MLSVCSACDPRVSGVGPARFAHSWRPSGVYIHASSSAHSFVHAQQSKTITEKDRSAKCTIKNSVREMKTRYLPQMLRTFGNKSKNTSVHGTGFF